MDIMSNYWADTIAYDVRTRLKDERIYHSLFHSDIVKKHKLNEIESKFLQTLSFDNILLNQYNIICMKDDATTKYRFGFCCDKDLNIQGCFMKQWTMVWLQIVPQYRIGQYKADFALLFSKNDNSYGHVMPNDYIIEIDGHEWHERTKEQASHDKQRERYLVKQGYKILRFTGSDVFNKAGECWYEICDTVFTECDRIHGKDKVNV